MTRCSKAIASAVVALVSLASFNAVVAAPYDEPQDAAVAINEPDKYAWTLFVALHWPADVDAKKADPRKTFGADGPVVWETWRNVRNGAPDTTFRPDGSDPGEWLTRTVPVAKRSTDFDAEPLQRFLRRTRERGGPIAMFDPVPATTSTNETRVNKDTYEFIRKHKLYNIEGQEELVKAGLRTISFPLNAKEIKAQWREISEADKPRYHWVEITIDNTKKIFGLTAWHIITKDVPNWFWATFEHVDNRLAEKDGGRPGNEGWLLKSRDRLACSTPPFDCNEFPKGIGLEGTKWQHYRLRGTQVDFVDSLGNSTLLANSQPEQFFQETSSCITCHARATIGTRVDTRANRLAVFRPDDQSFNGIPDPKWFEDDGAAGKYVQLDFVWSFFRARRSQ